MGSINNAELNKLFNRFQFAELNLRHRGNPERTLNLVRRAIRMGYDSVVINVDIGEFCASTSFTSNKDSVDPPPKKKKKKNVNNQRQQIDESVVADIIPDPYLVDESKLDKSSLEILGKKFRQYSLDANSVHKLQHNRKAKLYDIVAVRVPDENLLATLQRKGDFIDLITVDSNDGKISWMFKQKIVQSCIVTGLSFELCYADALYSTENRRQFFTNARRLMEITRRGRGVVMSSGAEDMISIRAPFDVSNLCVLFGMNPKEGRKFVSENAKDVLLRAESRKTIRGVVHVTSDALSIPTVSGNSIETLQQLGSVEEFRKELGSLIQVDNENEMELSNKEEKEESIGKLFEMFA